MLLSMPIYTLKRQAKRLARDTAIPLHQAQAQLARAEGYQSWSHLSAALRAPRPAARLLGRLEPSDLVLLAARPGHGKTLLALELLGEAAQSGRQALFFTLDYHDQDVAARLSELGLSAVDLTIDTSDQISAAHIQRRLDSVAGPALVVIDYLQLLDQDRSKPPLSDQIAALKTYLTGKDIICVAISQIDRRFDLSGKTMPDRSDVRLPNPLDLGLVDKTCFLHQGEVALNN